MSMHVSSDFIVVILFHQVFRCREIMMANNFRPPSGGNPKKRRRTSTPISNVELAPPPLGSNDTVFATNPFDDYPSNVSMPLGSPSGPMGMPGGHGMLPMGGPMLMHGSTLGNYGPMVGHIGPGPNVSMFGPCGPMFNCGPGIPTSCSMSGPNLCNRPMHSPMPQSISAPGSVSPHRSTQGSGPGTPVGPLSGGLIGPHGPSSVGPPIGHQGMSCHVPPGPSSHPNMVLGPMTSTSNERLYPPGHPIIFNPQNPSAPPIYPCGICRREVGDNDQAILCESGCNFWFHRVCTGLAEPAFHFLTQGEVIECSFIEKIFNWLLYGARLAN